MSCDLKSSESSTEKQKKLCGPQKAARKIKEEKKEYEKHCWNALDLLFSLAYRFKPAAKIKILCFLRMSGTRKSKIFQNWTFENIKY